MSKAGGRERCCRAINQMTAAAFVAIACVNSGDLSDAVWEAREQVRFEERAKYPARIDRRRSNDRHMIGSHARIVSWGGVDVFCIFE